MSLLVRLRDTFSSNDELATPLGRIGKSGDAGVLVAITDSADPHLLLTRRALTLTRHPGQIAFPGGHWEAEDPHLAHTALREAWEEVGIVPGSVSLLGELITRPSRYESLVTPYVGVIPDNLSLTLCPKEVDSSFMVPLDYFLTTAPVRIDHSERAGVRFNMPAWQYRDFEIWGLTAMIIDDLIKRMDNRSQ